MIGIVVVSHSRSLAESAIGLAMEMAQSEIRVVNAAGAADGGFGTDASRILSAIDSFSPDDQVAVIVIDMLKGFAEEGPLSDGRVGALAEPIDRFLKQVPRAAAVLIRERGPKSKSSRRLLWLAFISTPSAPAAPRRSQQSTHRHIATGAVVADARAVQFLDRPGGDPVDPTCRVVVQVMAQIRADDNERLGVVPEGGLGAVTVMDVEVEDGDGLRAPGGAVDVVE